MGKTIGRCHVPPTENAKRSLFVGEYDKEYYGNYKGIPQDEFIFGFI